MSLKGSVSQRVGTRSDSLSAEPFTLPDKPEEEENHKCVMTRMCDLSEEEQLKLCAKEEICPHTGKYRPVARPLKEFEEMMKAKEDAKAQAERDMAERHSKEADDLKKQLAQSQKDLEDYKALTEERFNKLVALIQKK